MDSRDPTHLSWNCDCHTSTLAYAGRFAGKQGEFMLNRQCEVLRKFLGIFEGKNILDVGAGHGQNARALISGGARYTALVSARGCDRKLREVLDGLGVDPDRVIRYGRIDSIPFGGGSFDAVISFRLVSHVPDWKLFLGELCRVSAKNVVIDFAPGASSLLKKLSYALKGKFEPASREFTTQGFVEIRREARRRGFELKQSERQFLLPMFVHRTAGNFLFFSIERAAAELGITRFAGRPAVALLERVNGL